MQTNKEFLDALDLQPEDGFLAVAVPEQANPEQQDNSNEFVPGPPPEKRRFRFEQSEDRFVFREYTQRSAGIGCLIALVAMYLLPVLLMPFFITGATVVYMFYFCPFLVLAFFCLLMICSRMEHTLDSSGLTSESKILFFKFVKRVPFHEIRSIGYHIYPKGLKSVDVKTDCEVLSVYNSNNVSVSEEECRWLAGTMQTFFLELKQSVKGNTKEEMPAPSKTRWKIHREYDRLVIVRRPLWLWRPLFFFTVMALVTGIVMTFFWLRFFDIIPHMGPEENRMTWKSLAYLIPSSFVCGMTICWFFSAWREALTWIRWTFTEKEIVTHSSWFLPPRRFEIHVPCRIAMRKSTSSKPLYRWAFGDQNVPPWPNANSFGDQELVIYDDTTDRTLILGDMTFAEAAWLCDVLVREKLVRR